MQKTFIVIIFCGLNLLQLSAQEPKTIIEQFFKNYQEKDCITAVKIAAKTNPWLQKDSILVNNWGKRLSKMSMNKGAYCGYEILETNKTGSCLIEYSCLIKHEKAPSKISIIVYKPKNKWQLNGILTGKISRNMQKNTKSKKR